MSFGFGIVVDGVPEYRASYSGDDQHQPLIILGEVGVVQLVDGLYHTHHTGIIMVHDGDAYDTLRLVVRGLIIARIESMVLVRIQDVQDLTMTSHPSRYTLRQLDHDHLLTDSTLVPQYASFVVNEEHRSTVTLQDRTCLLNHQPERVRQHDRGVQIEGRSNDLLQFDDCMNQPSRHLALKA